MRLMTVIVERKDGSEETMVYKDVYDIGHMNDGTLNCFRISREIKGHPERWYFPLDKYSINVTENDLEEKP